MRYAGEVHFLPPDEAEGGDDKSRRHVLLADCEDEDAICTFAYASTQDTEAQYGAANHLVNPIQTTYRATGFVRPTYVYPSRLVAYESSELNKEGFAGRLTDDMPLIRDQLRYALGLGTGTAQGAGPATSSYRGRLVKLAGDLARSCGWELAVIVTEPLYSKQRRFQTIVPLFSADEYDDGPGRLSIQDKSWLASLNWGRALAFIPYVSSAFHWREFADVLPLVVDEATMDEIDFALRVRFAL